MVHRYTKTPNPIWALSVSIHLLFVPLAMRSWLANVLFLEPEYPYLLTLSIFVILQIIILSFQ